MSKSEGHRPTLSSHILFPVETSTQEDYEILAILEPREVQHLLAGMGFLQDLMADDNRKETPATLDGDRIRDPVISSSCTWDLAGRRSSSSVKNVSWACPLHPAAAASFSETTLMRDVTVHVMANAAYLSGSMGGVWFWSKEVHWADVMSCRLATADRKEVPGAFRDLASLAPDWAIDVLESGLVLEGSREIVRDVAGLLSPADITSLLTDRDGSVRARAIKNLGRCGRT